MVHRDGREGLVVVATVVDDDLCTESRVVQTGGSRLVPTMHCTSGQACTLCVKVPVWCDH